MAGGGLFNEYGTPSLSVVIFSHNHASRRDNGSGGGGMASVESNPVLNDVTFEDNWVESNNYGGGLFISSNSDPILTDVVFDHNWVETGYMYGYGGGMFSDYYSNPSLNNVSFTDNSAFAGGGYCNGVNSYPKLNDVTFVGNHAEDGGGMLDGTYGGSILTDVIFNGNTANRSGGGLFALISGTLILSNVTFDSNTAATGGGMAITDNTNTTLTNVTFSGNSADQGGAIANIENSSLSMIHVTLGGNGATREGGGVFNSSSQAEIRNTLLWGNTAPVGSQIQDSDSVTTVSDSVVEGGFPGGTNIIITDPLLGLLGDYGGFTSVIPLLRGSSAIDAANPAYCPTIDQRGTLRPYDGNQDGAASCDIGAYEYNDHIFRVTTSGTGDCASWVSACSLQTALAITSPNDEIWVSAGLYTPGTARTDTFQLAEDVAVYGGFAGTETERDARDPEVKLTILSGDIDHDDSQTPVITDPTTVTGNTTNSEHVVTGADGAILDGFTITAGYADQLPDDEGGGIYNFNTSPILSHLVLTGNMGLYSGAMYNFQSRMMISDSVIRNNSAYQGGGVYNDHSDVQFLRVSYVGNTASTRGGGGMLNHTCNVNITNSSFINNSAVQVGGAIDNLSSDLQLNGVVFENNLAHGLGGAISNISGEITLIDSTLLNNISLMQGGGISTWEGNAILSNVTIIENSAKYAGGAIYTSDASVYLYHVTLFGNKVSNGGGGGIHFSNSSEFETEIRNSIIWGNEARENPQIAGVSANISDSVIQDGYETGTNIITDDPLLGILGDYGGFTSTLPLLFGSSAIDTANPAYCPATDQRGVVRPQRLICDIGAFEFIFPFVLIFPLVQRQ